MPDGSTAGFTVKDLPAPIWIDGGDWCESKIPERPWIAPSFLLRGSITMLSGAASASKSTLAVAWAISLALHRPFSGFRPVGPMRVAVYNCEDDQDEQRRRFSAALRQFGAEPASLAGRVVRLGPNNVGTLLEPDPDGRLIFTPAMTRLEQTIEDFRPDVLILDPLVELHGMEENDNTALRSVMARFRSLAQQYQMAVVLVHHARKGAALAAPGDPDTLRGASAIVGAARVVLTVAGMTEDEAVAFGLPADARRNFFRVDGAKSNYSSLTEADWFERQVIRLDNGDYVAAPLPWTPPNDRVSLEQRNAIKAGIEAGSPLGPWSAKLSDDQRSVRHLLEQHDVKRSAQTKLLKVLRAEGYVAADYKASGRQVRQGLRSPDGAPHSANWCESNDE